MKTEVSNNEGADASEGVSRQEPPQSMTVRKLRVTIV